MEKQKLELRVKELLKDFEIETIQSKESVELLISLCLLYDVENDNIKNLFYLASKEKRLDTIKMLISYGFEIPDNLLEFSTACGANEISEYLLNETDIDVSYGDSVALCNFLSISEPEIDFELFVKMVEKGANVNAQNGSPLFFAIQNSNDKIFDYLIDNGAKISGNKNVPIIASAQYGTVHMVERLLEFKEVDETVKDSMPIRWAIRDRSISKFKLLFKRYTKVPLSVFREAYFEAVEHYNFDFMRQILISEKIIENECDHSIILEQYFKASLNTYLSDLLCDTEEESFYSLLTMYLSKCKFSKKCIKECKKKVKKNNPYAKKELIMALNSNLKK